jgi:hypothetical protein
VYKFKGTIFALSICGLLIGCEQTAESVSTNSSGSSNTVSSSIKTGGRSIASIEKINVHTVSLCGKTFDDVSAAVNSSNFYIAAKSITHSKLVYKFSIPGSVSVSSVKAKSAEVQIDTKSIAVENPVVPGIPLLPLDENPQICKNVIDYHKAFTNNFASITSTFNSSAVLNVSGTGKGVRLTLKPDLAGSVKAKGAELENFTNNLISQKRPLKGGGKPINNAVSIIIYDDLYANEVAAMAAIYTNQGHNMLLLPLSQLPGLNANGAVPVECAGVRERECYHTWADTISDVSPLAVPGLKGFFSQTPLNQIYNKVSYIPGLVRAYIRGEKKKHEIRGVFLIGNDDYMAPFFTYRERYMHPSQSGMYKNNRKLATNIFYAVPDAPMEPQTTAHSTITSASIWSCANGAGEVNLRPWCLDNESRHWPTPALSAYGWTPVSAHSRAMNFTGYSNDSAQFSHNAHTGLELKDVIPIGRLYTRYDKKGVKDPTVAEYVKKISRWHKSLPNLNTAIAVHGGAESWIHTQGELDSFQATFGQSAKIYASEMHVGNSKCIGRCEYKSGPEIIGSFNNPINRAAYHFTAHGSNWGHQLTHGGAAGEIAAKEYVPTFRNINMGSDIHATKTTATAGESIIAMENGTLFGVIFANSCFVSDIQYLENDISDRMKAYYGDVDHRSYAEHVLKMKNGGAVNLFLNNDVGWGGDDSHYNAKFMQKLKIASDTCGDIGEAVRMTWFDMLSNNRDGAGYYQLMNRQLLGSPFNKIKKRSPACDGVTFEENSNEL